MNKHTGSVNCCNKIRERRTCNYCGYPESEAMTPPTPEPCSCEKNEETVQLVSKKLFNLK